MKIVRPLPRLLPALALVSLPALARAAEKSPVAAFLTRLESAANRGDAAALKTMSAAGAAGDFGWTKEGGGLLGRRRPWQAKMLALPGLERDANGTFVAFTRYNPCESTGDHLYRVALGAEGPHLGSELPETETGGYRVRDHKLSVRFDVPRRHVYLTDHVTVERQANPLPAVVLRINAIYTVTAVRRSGAAVPFHQAGGFLAVKAPDAGRASFDLAYNGLVEGSREDFIRPNEAALTSYWYPHTSRLPATSEVRITAPRGWVSIGQGEMIGKSVASGTVTTSWRNTLPVSYLTVAAGKYTVTTQKMGGIAVSAYMLGKDRARAKLAINAAGSALLWFSKNFSRFPYSHYAVVETDVFPAALECYSFTLAGRALVPIAITHEVAHTWWGGVVPNTYTRSLWNESFAEYSDGLFGRRAQGIGMHEFTTQMASSGALFSSVSLANAHDAMAMGDSLVGYGKGSLVLENLERMLGTPKMLDCMRRFIADHEARKPGEDAEWPDFIQAVAETAGPEWAGYFPSWLERTDLPALRLQNVTVEREGGKYVVTGTVAQESPPFWLAVPVAVQTETGEVQQQVLLKGESVEFQIETAAKPSRVSVDPSYRTLRASSLRGIRPDLIGMHVSSAPLLVVYATGGSAAENAADQQVATAQAKEVFPFAQIVVKPDTAVTAENLEAANVLLIGRAEHLRLPEGWRERLPLRYTDDEIQLGARRWKGADLWGLAVVPHPTRPKGLLAHAASTGPEAIRGFHHQGDLEGSDSLFVLRAPGKVLMQEAPVVDDPTVVRLTL